MSADIEEAVELLRRAELAEPGSIARTLLTVAAFDAAAANDLILVGGAAVNIHTGSYRPTDIDVVGWLSADDAPALNALGFEKRGRHWLHIFADGETPAIEVAASGLFDMATDPPVVYDLEPGHVAVISLNDLVMDRLLQATGGEPVTFDEAVRLAIAAYESIDWDMLAVRTAAAAENGTSAKAELPEALKRVRRAARRAIRN